ncbi:Multidrug resistance protein MdtN [Fundidesulfovibrio magnetotacticus]|uniref:Multidrug resistance protein MdtN n=1 Tax=Fundidesulfovibrio magnetotacticus TaxID=2730080 RepID=A0A6V8LUC3_9BACT|nr:HlyD family secretion protein [Fundidesulfovibrio magnetotacticus]GFK93928.1 Multidrug resistance protein MdtN [Fundidesulfovibrio magnetotacticus]
MRFERRKTAVTLAVVLLAVLALGLKYRQYLVNPWTRDGQVRANVVLVSPRVSGPIVRLPVVDNQRVAAGDLLFEIDPRTFESKLKEAQANLDLTLQNLAALDHQVRAAEEAVRQAESRVKQAESGIADFEAQLLLARKNLGRASTLVAEATIPVQAYDQSKETHDTVQARRQQAQSALRLATAAKRQADAELDRSVTARGPLGEDNPQLRAARAALEDARLNLEFTRQQASVDGYVTNLNLRLGSQAVANQPALALVDASSFWISGYFMETQVGRIQPGHPAVVTLMSYPDKPLQGVVESIGWGIFQKDGSTGQDLLPTVSPTFEWIRLAQRIPVRVRLLRLEEGVLLRAGVTASVLVMTGDKPQDLSSVPPAPALLQ